MPEQRFTFTFSPQIPRRHVRCNLCGWQMSAGSTPSIIDMADAHTCAGACTGAGDCPAPEHIEGCFSEARRRESPDA